MLFKHYSFSPWKCWNKMLYLFFKLRSTALFFSIVALSLDHGVLFFFGQILWLAFVRIVRCLNSSSCLYLQWNLWSQTRSRFALDNFWCGYMNTGYFSRSWRFHCAFHLDTLMVCLAALSFKIYILKRLLFVPGTSIGTMK